jgi:hypothetical protein
MLAPVATITFAYNGATRGVDDGQALFLAEGLARRALFSTTAGRLAQRILHERDRDVELDEEERENLLHVLDQADLDKQLDQELRDLQTMLRGEQ